MNLDEAKTLISQDPIGSPSVDFKSAGARVREAVRTRKSAIAEGTGTVHGETFVLEHWGIAELPAVL